MVPERVSAHLGSLIPKPSLDVRLYRCVYVCVIDNVML